MADKHSAVLSDQDNSSETTPGNEKEQVVKWRKPWIRLLYIVLYLIIFSIVETLIWLTTAVCFISVLFKPAPPDGVGKFGRLLAVYARDVVSFLTYNRKSPPWPFDKFNSMESA